MLSADTVAENFTENKCGAGFTVPFICKPTTPNAVILNMNVQDAINRAAAALGINDNVTLSGNIGADTANLAFAVLLKAPLNVDVKSWLTLPDSKPETLAQRLATSPRYAIATFDALSKYDRPATLLNFVTPEIADKIAKGKTETPKLAAPSYWTTNRKIVVGIASGVLVGFVAGMLRAK